MSTMSIINASIRALLAVTTLTIEPMMFLWSVAGGMAKVSTDQMILYKVPVSDVERIIIKDHHRYNRTDQHVSRYVASSTTLLTSATQLKIRRKQKNTIGQRILPLINM